uniref:Uncharacterized protein n=1 Tax=Chromera velia CCMP2878 TaxID=1169474 RepID=A0A0G4HZB3_9ALVE|eukprot:Cvel_9692.t1-p1 / transcript=Cvel_9692.t1 / gene=Cvel_9692 / organism=Chromera_velia_CCMP2878 / gene_product=Eukaryotic translation initiation factor 4E type 2, putative / transcript_product=Eukaryotic translation initiation factor 4E type 2, putative / location=Cvel_scaffold565:5508-10096(-) / protein_length=339 / sequence_SO=supercontig / SO=protein_coding / is_pseudo=false
MTERKVPKRLTHEERKVHDWPQGENPLETEWTLWFEKKLHIQQSTQEYEQNLKQVGTFSTLEGFHRLWRHLRRASEIPPDRSVSVFRKGIRPMWEAVPYGGAWIVKVKRANHEKVVDCLWERMVFGCIGELFGCPELAGVVLSSRHTDVAFSVWNESNSNPRVQGHIGERLREICGLPDDTLLQYKCNMQSIKDMSSYKNAQYFMFTPNHEPAEAPLHVMHGMDGTANGIPHDVFPPLPEAEMDKAADGEGETASSSANAVASPSHGVGAKEAGKEGEGVSHGKGGKGGKGDGTVGVNGPTPTPTSKGGQKKGGGGKEEKQNHGKPPGEGAVKATPTES